MPGKHLPPDHSRGDADTIGGYMSVHARPAAFEGSDGMSYSVAIEADRIGGDNAGGRGEHAFAAYFLFLRWRRVGAQGVEGHLESEYLAHGATPAEARSALGAWRLDEVREVLESRIRDAAPGGERQRRWWDVMREGE